MRAKETELEESLEASSALKRNLAEREAEAERAVFRQRVAEANGAEAEMDLEIAKKEIMRLEADIEASLGHEYDDEAANNLSYQP